MGYWRDVDDVRPQARVNRTVHDWAGRAIAQWDPRLFLDASAPANLQTTHALSGAELSTNSVDAGWRVALLGEAGQPIHYWDGRGSQRWMQYDTQLRPESVFEQPLDGKALCTERLSYGASDQASAERNQCGQLIRHDDPAGSQQFAEFGLHGTALGQTRHFLNDLMLPDWPESIADRELLLEPGEGATTRSQVNALGEASHQTDAKGHRQLFSQTLDGQLREVRLQLNGTPTPKTLVSAITYNAHGQTEREVAGNGVITTLEYDAQNGRLTRLSAQRGNEVLQDLNYAYDPVGNVLSIKDAALPIRYFANQRIEPTSHYRYDSFSQLIEATGWEAGGSNKGPQFATFDDPAACANFRQQYSYDPGGNLLELTHEGPQSHGHRLVAAAHSNRCLPVLEGVEPGEDDFRRGFDANGNLLNLQPGQTLSWDLRNQLYEVRPVERVSGLNDRERYVYGADGMRLRKVRETLAHARTLVAETRYLPNLELRNYSGTGEVLQVINVQAGRCSVRVLHWESETPKDAANDQYRYHLNDHLGSCTLELDKDGEVISQERYHPYGTTAWFSGRGEVEASYRTVRYSGKEQDVTGLYYYGYRYYQPGAGRWLSSDPAGAIDGLNLYRMVRNNPVNLADKNGLAPDTIEEALEILVNENVGDIAQEVLRRQWKSKTWKPSDVRNETHDVEFDVAKKTLSYDERNAIAKYTGTDFQELVRQSRVGGGQSKMAKNNTEIHNVVTALLLAMDKLPDPKFDIIYRGVNGFTGFNEDTADGAQIKNKGFESFSSGRAVGMTIDKDTLLMLKNPEGIKISTISALSAFPGEREVLLGPNPIYVIEDVITEVRHPKSFEVFKNPDLIPTMENVRVVISATLKSAYSNWRKEYRKIDTEK
ncbi:RHS repeat-associated core domain-containing protein [Pseudomonas azerbaijanorientalis]|uniref:RHS repeat-associated core domain-containing protein n=1 Tax=Pseudomonas azerbaijanorientalis TaxID=2842350 RepID=UPI001C3DFB58|nr:RHS repeat-associated core domain-containing protein [Pseudomonas azerbaijanorientalis]QXH61129.1 RHS repeat protein [Pseudomonas azerbaijanorientalis]